MRRRLWSRGGSASAIRCPRRSHGPRCPATACPAGRPSPWSQGCAPEDVNPPLAHTPHSSAILVWPGHPVLDRASHEPLLKLRSRGVCPCLSSQPSLNDAPANRAAPGLPGVYYRRGLPHRHETVQPLRDHPDLQAQDKTSQLAARSVHQLARQPP